MMSAEVIRDFQRQAARRASKDKLHPYILDGPEELVNPEKKGRKQD